MNIIAKQQSINHFCEFLAVRNYNFDIRIVMSSLQLVTMTARLRFTGILSVRKWVGCAHRQSKNLSGSRGEPPGKCLEHVGPLSIRPESSRFIFLPFSVDIMSHLLVVENR
jgi:hypothetical protein